MCITVGQEPYFTCEVYSTVQCPGPSPTAIGCTLQCPAIARTPPDTSWSPTNRTEPCIHVEAGCKLTDSFDQSDAQNMDTDQLISQESSWPAGWPQLPYQPSFSTAALEHQAAFPVDTSCARATGFSSRPPHLRKGQYRIRIGYSTGGSDCKHCD